MKSPKQDVPLFWTQSNKYTHQLEFDKFYIYSSKKKIFKEVELAKLMCVIVRKKKKMDGYMVANISDCIIQIIENDLIGHGIQFSKQAMQFQFFGKNILDWFDSLKKFCFQVDFYSKYELQNLLQRGSTYKVYEALNIFESANYCVKVYEKQLNNLDAVLKEISIFRIMEYPGIINLIEVFDNEEGYILVYEKSEGGTLSDVIKKYQIPESQAIKIIFRLLNSLIYIHEHNVLHRNIKPENIKVKNILQLENVMIADFSLADYFRKDGKYMFTRCGTPGYVAPEILQDRGYDFTADVYSLGVVFFMMLSGGVSPFPTKNYDERIYLNYKGNINYSQLYATDESMDLLQKMLEFSPSKRLTASKAIWHQAFRGLHKLKIQSYEPERRNSSIRLTTKQTLPPKIVENLKITTNPQYQIQSGSQQFHRRQKFRITYKNRHSMTGVSSPILSPARNLLLRTPSKETIIEQQ